MHDPRLFTKQVLGKKLNKCWARKWTTARNWSHKVICEGFDQMWSRHCWCVSSQTKLRKKKGNFGQTALYSHSLFCAPYSVIVSRPIHLTTMQIYARYTNVCAWMLRMCVFEGLWTVCRNGLNVIRPAQRCRSPSQSISHPQSRKKNARYEDPNALRMIFALFGWVVNTCNSHKPRNSQNNILQPIPLGLTF